ncbi:hypothetical protein [Cupriavidus metallidurans]|jgi:hypothetical protein|uniref:Uncharacterized protein n=1 Tax=Cupriavidus metallidurans TaxID=119219 RepID=A0A482ITF6_9BURK|nr:hypothetical protein [Cupriavidus metallidurans]QBP10459.1 hypothetical protein DDF84_012210 [Cupriavidus metallidurans]QWC87532.1 hypothetical protein KB891_10750 [Cupriavidus metallidurans]
MKSLLLERYYPYFLAGVGTLAWYKFGQVFAVDAQSFLSAALGLSGTILGFLATAQSILMALPSDSVMGQLKRSGYIDDLVRYLRESLYVLAAYAAWNLYGFAVVEPKSNALPLWYRTTWIALAIVSAASFHRVTEIVLRIMKRR